jgi:putative FmdB family regulatory protein
MPLYEYKCERCDAVLEVLQRYSEAPLTVHDGCGGALHKLLTAPSFRLKGTGWYATDYAKKSSTSGSNGEAKGEAKTPANGSGSNGSGSEASGSNGSSSNDSSEKPAASKDDSSKPAAPAAPASDKN